MNNSTFKIEILTPYGKYLSIDANFLEVKTMEYVLGILPNHSPLISTVDISKMIIKSFNETYTYAVGGGVINVSKDKTTLMLESIERIDEIDISRAYEAKSRAEARLNGDVKDIDIKRAKASLLRALNRIKIYENK